MSEQIPKDNMIGNLKNRYAWKRIERPLTWRPKTVGEELIGLYGGKTQRVGKFGAYDVVLVHVPAVGSFTLTGVQVIQKFDAASMEIGWPVRVEWRGYEEWDDKEKPDEKRRMKCYEVYVAEGVPVPAEFLPRLQEDAGVTPQ
jgi:hypothetical protein